jgi:hypothetical protein
MFLFIMAGALHSSAFEPEGAACPRPFMEGLPLDFSHALWQ